ncbi:MAG: hypothetical protein M5U08_21685 [Burkholderiales bacterium]|nr:hypothetical protein [Burkholderiales bacterium]
MHRSSLKCIVAVGAAVLLAAQSGPASARELAQQTSRDRGVTVQVKPVDLSPGAKSWAFEVVLDTHSQDLADDLVRTTMLEAGGATLAPTGWEGDPPGGHHRKGVLRFAPITPMPEAVELLIARPGESAPRSFR